MILAISTETARWATIIGVGIALVAVVVAFFSYVSTVRNSLSQRLLDRYYSILQVSIDNPHFVDPELTRNYETAYASKEQRHSYESFARLCWSHARDVLDAHFLLVFFRRQFIRQYANAFEIYRSLHYPWLERNETFVPSPRFRRFIRRCRWRDYVDPRTADQLRWSYAEEGFLNPATARPDCIGDFIAERDVQERRHATVADLGCGQGALVKRLCEAGFGRVIGVDYSSKMLARAATQCGGSSTEFKKLDLTDLSHLPYNSLNVAFSTNSILPREPADTPVILREIAAALKAGGRLVAILPAFDTVTELKRFELSLFVERRQNRGGISRRPLLRGALGRADRWKAFHVEQRMSGWFGNSCGRWRPVRFVARKLFARPIGPHQYADDGANIQRFIKEHEIRRRFARAGLEITDGPTRVNYDGSSRWSRER